MWPEVLANYARHHATGEPLPQDVVDKLDESRLWGEGLRHHRVSGRCPAGPGLARAGRPEVPDDALAFEAKALAAAGIAHAPDPAALPDRLLPAHLRRRGLRRRLLLLHLERGARRRDGGVVQGKRRPDPRQRRPVPRRSCSPGATAATRWSPSAPSAAATPNSSRCSSAAAWTRPLSRRSRTSRPPPKGAEPSSYLSRSDGDNSAAGKAATAAAATLRIAGGSAPSGASGARATSRALRGGAAAGSRPR